MTSSQLCWKGTVFSAAPAHGHVCMWWCTPMRRVVWCVVGECERVLWRGGVVGAGKKGRGKDTVKQKQKGLFPKPLFPFSLFFHLFFFHLFSLPSTLPPSLPSYPCTRLFPCFTHGCIRGEPKNTNDTTSDSFHRLFFLYKLSFSLLFLLQMIQCWLHHNQILSNHQITFI